MRVTLPKKNISSSARASGVIIISADEDLTGRESGITVYSLHGDV